MIPSTSPWKTERWSPGVLNKRQMLLLRDAQIIRNSNEEIDRDASALDLHLTSEGYKMIKGSIKPFNKSYIEIISDSYYAVKLQPESDNSFLLKKGDCYLFRIKEQLHPCIKNAPIYGQATAKSTIGRVDVIARLIVDGMKEYETFNPNDVDSGEMFIEITPITFDVKVKEGISISQLRFFFGEIEDSIISAKDFIRSVLHIPENFTNAGTLSVDVSNITLNDGKTLAAAFQARDDIKVPIELWKKAKEEERYSQQDFWNPVPSTERDNLKSVIIAKNKFYILRSIERISLTRGVCIYCRAMDETLGEMRIHYAGFVHPCFGDERKDHRIGTPLIFEVRGHNVDILLTHNEILARLFFYRMSEEIEANEEIESDTEIEIAKTTEERSYNEQELDLSSLFQKGWEKIN